MSAPISQLELALSYAERGWQVFPVFAANPDGTCTCPAGGACGNTGKHPRTLHGFKASTDDPDQITKWWAALPDASIGIRTGEESGLWVLDPDEREGGLERLAELEAKHGQLDAPRVRTGGGGLHLYFAWNSDLDIRSRSNVMPGIDVRGSGGYVVAAGSLHKSGRLYSWETGSPPDALPQAPDWLLELVCAKDPVHGGNDADTPGTLSRSDIARIETALEAIPNNDREVWLRIGMALHSTRAPEARGIWDKWSLSSSKFDVHDQEKTWGSFTLNKQPDITLRTLFKLAKDNGWTDHNVAGGDGPAPKPWTTPDWLWRQDPLPILNIEAAFPPTLTWLGDYCYEHTRVFQTPVEFGALTALGMISGAIGGRYEIQLENVEWREACPLWVLIGMYSGAGKSLLFKVMREPFDEFERKLDQTKEFAEWEAALHVASYALKAAEANTVKVRKQNPDADLAGPQKKITEALLAYKLALALKPPNLTITASNFTTAALSKFLMEHAERCLILDPEGSVFGHALGGDNEIERNLDPWLKSYSCEQIKENRIGDGTTASMERFAKRPILAMAVCTQPGNLAFFRDAYAAAKGFLARFIVVVLPYKLPEVAFAEGAFDSCLRSRWNDTLLQLVRRGRQKDPITVVLEGEPANEFKRWVQGWLDQAKRDVEGDASSPVGYGSAFGAKLRGIALRIILSLHVLQHEKPEAISPDLATVRAVLDVLVPFIQAHVARLSKFIRDDPDTQIAERIIRWLARHPDVAQFSRAQLLRALKESGSDGAIARVNDLNGALSVLVETGWIRPVGQQPGRGPNVLPVAARYDVHPELAAHLAKFEAAEKDEEAA